MICKAKIIYQPEYTPERPYNVQLWHSYDGGKSFVYAGFGRFCKTKEEAEDYVKFNAKTIEMER